MFIETLCKWAHYFFSLHFQLDSFCTLCVQIVCVFKAKFVQVNHKPDLTKLGLVFSISNEIAQGGKSVDGKKYLCKLGFICKVLVSQGYSRVRNKCRGTYINFWKNLRKKKKNDRNALIDVKSELRFWC